LRLETERLSLVPPSLELVPEIHDYFNRNRDFLAPWRPFSEEKFFTIEHQEKMLRDELLSIQQGKMLKYWLQYRTDRMIIGQICFSQIIRGPFQSCFLGYSLDNEYLRQGFMTEGLKEAVSIVFDEEILHRIEANIMPRNTASIRVVEKLGFQNEGIAVEYLKINGVWEDHTHMVLLNPNY
jgi:[ribosomal protein S5]-alanine N-acetyltransferase